MRRVIAHMGLNAAVEALDHPHWAGLPLVVGGDARGIAVMSRARLTPHPTDDDTETTRLPVLALGRVRTHRPSPIRLRGVAVSRLTPGSQLREQNQSGARPAPAPRHRMKPPTPRGG